eukprot:scaffold4791_cov144-Cylindrotheca_fusiformis.AAC.2
MTEIVSEPAYLRNVNTFDSLEDPSNDQKANSGSSNNNNNGNNEGVDAKKPAGSPASKFLGRIQERASALFSCGRAEDIEDPDSSADGLPSAEI